jgi:hypothetical protein
VALEPVFIHLNTKEESEGGKERWKLKAKEEIEQF